MKKNGKKNKRREALKQWLKKRLGGFQPQQKQTPTSSRSKFIA